MIKSMCYIIESDQSVQILQTFVFENVWVHIWGHDISSRKVLQPNFYIIVENEHLFNQMSEIR